MKIITVGAGFIASHLPYKMATKEGEFGITIPFRLTPNEEDIYNLIDEYKPDVIVNCIGYCGNKNIDSCQLEKSRTYMANVTIPLMLAEACEKYGVHMIHIGSGCIFYGKSPNVLEIGTTGLRVMQYSIEEDLGWKEEDYAHPQSYYSKTKYACDLVLGQMKNVLTARIRMPISSKNSERNFINKIKNYNQIINIPNSVTFVSDLVMAIDWFIKNQKTGIYHVTNPQPLSAVDVMLEYKKYIRNHKFEIISEEELDKLTVAKRSNCIINCDKLKNEGFEMTPSIQALENCMKEFIGNI